ncbi:MAG: cobalamin-dependent protein [Desulfobacterales bacterium]|jgi:5-methyltetrahydrofolate--homocysteine methyltransferase
MEAKLKSAFLEKKRQEGIDIVKKALAAGEDSFRILRICRKIMEEVGNRFESGEYFLSELIYAAEVFKAISTILEPNLLASIGQQESRGVVVFGTPQGDIHDLGKNIVVTLMRSQGFSVHDMGVDVPAERLVDEVERQSAPILALSALITPAFVSMKEVIFLLKKRRLREKTFVIIGGGVTTEFARKQIGADAQTLDPTVAMRLCRRHIRKSGAAVL